MLGTEVQKIKRESGINFEKYLVSHFSKTIAGEGRIDRSTKVKMFLTPFSYDGNHCKIQMSVNKFTTRWFSDDIFGNPDVT